VIKVGTMPRPASDEIKIERPSVIAIAGQEGKFVKGTTFWKPLRVFEGSVANEKFFYEIVKGTSTVPNGKNILPYLQYLLLPEISF